MRAYKSEPLLPGVVKALEQRLAQLNSEGHLHMQLILNEPRAFQCRMAKYGKFLGVSNYVIIAGQKAEDLDERVGYYGEDLVLYAQTLGLNTCWVGITYSKVPGTYVLDEGEKVACRPSPPDCVKPAVLRSRNHFSKTIAYEQQTNHH